MNRKANRLPAVLLVAISAAGTAVAQEPATRPRATPDVAITGSVTARELRFDTVPNVRVEFPGNPERETVWEAERENLPRPVEPGVTYRDVGIRLFIRSVFADIDRIVAEALGEVPVDDEPAPEEPPREPAPEPVPQAAPARGGGLR